MIRTAKGHLMYTHEVAMLDVIEMVSPSRGRLSTQKQVEETCRWIAVCGLMPFPWDAPSLASHLSFYLFTVLPARRDIEIAAVR